MFFYLLLIYIFATWRRSIDKLVGVRELLKVIKDVY